MFCREVIAASRNAGDEDGRGAWEFQQAGSRSCAGYSWPEWRRLRREVLAVDNCECQECKRRGVYSKASIVHHVRHLRDRPDLALSVYDGDSRQLEAVCKRCHEELHPDSQRQYAPSAPPLTPERWD